MSLELVTMCGQDYNAIDNLMRIHIKQVFRKTWDKDLNTFLKMIESNTNLTVLNKYKISLADNCISVTRILSGECIAEIAEAHRIAVRDTTRNSDKVYYRIYKSKELIDTSWCYTHQIQGVSEMLKSYNQEIEITKIEKVRTLSFN